MNGLRLLVLLLLALLILPGAQAVRMIGGDDTNVITDPIEDDVFASGGTITFDAPIGSLVAAGGEINVNGPVAGDVIAAGGRVRINSSVGGKVVLAGGEVDLNGRVDRNAVVAGGQVVFGPNSSVGRDAEVSGGSFTHRGAVNGTLGVSSSSFENSGTAGAVRYDGGMRPDRGDRPDGSFLPGAVLAGLAAVLSFLFTLGYLILGLLLLLVAPRTALALETRARDQPLPAFVIGLVSLIAAVILGIVLLVTVVGAPIAILGWLAVIAGIMLAGLVVSLAVGRVVGRVIGLGENRFALFVVGFVLLNLLYLIPFLGGLIKFVVVCLGFGVLVMMGMDMVSASRRTT